MKVDFHPLPQHLVQDEQSSSGQVILPESVKSRNNNNSDEKNRIREEMDGSRIRNWEQLWLERKANENKKLLEKYKYNCANNAKSKGLLNNYNKKFFT